MKGMLFFIGLLAALITISYGQEADSLKAYHEKLDSLYITEFESKGERPKVLHAEPLYIDLIRDLGAHKGEHEWNIGFGIKDNLKYDTYQALIEYEWAAVDRLGLEIELPFTFVARNNGYENDSLPQSRMESLKLATQWTFLVLPQHNVSLALGYIHEFEFSPLRNFGKPLFTGNIYNPFFIAAKRFGNNYHTLIYTGPRIEQEFRTGKWHSSYEMHTNFHYMISGTRNFIGVEINKYIIDKNLEMVLRPQIRVGIADNFLIGIINGIPLRRESQRFSSFMRIIWEPGHRIARR